MAETLRELIAREFESFKAEYEMNLATFQEIGLSEFRIRETTINDIERWLRSERVYQNGLKPSATNTERGAKVLAASQFLQYLREN